MSFKINLLAASAIAAIGLAGAPATASSVALAAQQAPNPPPVPFNPAPQPGNQQFSPMSSAEVVASLVQGSIDRLPNNATEADIQAAIEAELLLLPVRLPGIDPMDVIVALALVASNNRFNQAVVNAATTAAQTVRAPIGGATGGSGGGSAGGGNPTPPPPSSGGGGGNSDY